MRLKTSSKPTLDISDISSSFDRARHANDDDVDGCCCCTSCGLADAAENAAAPGSSVMDAMAAMTAVEEWVAIKAKEID